MAPRACRQAAGTAAAAAGPACGLADVPTGVLHQILGQLRSRRDRQRAALVCRRWHDCVHSGELCGEVVATGALASLTQWLRRHGQLVHTLRLFVLGEEGYLNSEEGLLLGCCLATCSGLARLQHLHIDSFSLAASGAWLEPLRGLRELSLTASHDSLHMRHSLERHSQLTALRLRGLSVQFNDGVELPPSVRRLEIQDQESLALPDRMSALTQLSALRLAHGGWISSGCAVLARLPALRVLHLCTNGRLPGCLGQLTGLEELEIIEREDDPYLDYTAANQRLNASLQPLVRLTSLVLNLPASRLGLPALASLSRLEELSLDGGMPPSLPSGQWIAGVERLSAGWACLCSSTQALAGAAALEHLTVQGSFPPEELRPCRSLSAWLAAHLPLGGLLFALHAPMHASMRSALARLQQRRPELQVTVTVNDDPPQADFLDAYASLLFL